MGDAARERVAAFLDFVEARGEHDKIADRWHFEDVPNRPGICQAVTDVELLASDLRALLAASAPVPDADGGEDTDDAWRDVLGEAFAAVGIDPADYEQPDAWEGCTYAAAIRGLAARRPAGVEEGGRDREAVRRVVDFLTDSRPAKIASPIEPDVLLAKGEYVEDGKGYRDWHRTSALLRSDLAALVSTSPRPAGVGATWEKADAARRELLRIADLLDDGIPAVAVSLRDCAAAIPTSPPGVDRRMLRARIEEALSPLVGLVNKESRAYIADRLLAALAPLLGGGA